MRQIFTRSDASPFNKPPFSDGPEGRALPAPQPRHARPSGPSLNSADTFAAAADGVATAGVMPLRPSLAKLLASHILRDGELVLLIVRPSLWFILLSSLRFLGGALILITIARVISLQTHSPIRSYVELCVSAIAGRLMWATLQWSNRLYILTDMRVLALEGVFQIDVFDCALRKVARTRIIRSTPDRITAVGSIEIIPQDPDHPIGAWVMIDQPMAVNEQIIATISRAKGNNAD